MKLHGNAANLTGQVFGRLTVIGPVGRTPSQSIMWMCLCSCGRATSTPTTSGLRNGNSTSCGVCVKTGDNSWRWVHERPSYQSVHLRLAKALGKASCNQCAKCGSPANDWSYDHTDPDELRTDEGHTYSGNLNHYKPLCRTCHRQQDVMARPVVICSIAGCGTPQKAKRLCNRHYQQSRSKTSDTAL